MTYKANTLLANLDIPGTIAKEITDLIIESDIKYFDIGGSLKPDIVDPNVVFMIDPMENTSLFDLIASLFSEELAELSKEDEQTIEKETKSCIAKICDDINTNYLKTITQKLAQLLQIDDPTVLSVNITDVELCDYSSFDAPAKYTYRMEKEHNDGIIDQQEIANFIAENCKNIEDVTILFEQEKNNNNPIFDNIKSLTPGTRFLYNLYVSMVVKIKEDLNPEIQN